MEQQSIMELQEDFKQTRFFDCPCGKIYRSYPALYTHVRNKHEGKSPGQLQKPEFDSRKTRRTNKTSSKSTLESQKSILSSSAFPIDEDSSNGNQKNPTKEECISKIAEILEGLPQKDISRRYMNEMTAITEMNVYLSTRQSQSSKNSIGEVLAEFLEELSKKSDWSRFRYCFALLMVYVELILQKVKQNSMIENIPADILCLYVNQFLDGGAQEIALSYDISGLQIFEKDTMLAVLFWLFRWMLEKGYISYKIGLNPALYPSQEVSF